MINAALVFGMLVCITINAAVLLLILRCVKGITVTVTVQQAPAAAPAPDEAVNLAAVQEAIDKMEKQQREEQQQLNDLVGSINEYMIGGGPNGK